MADAELVRVLDFILNRCDQAAIDAVAAAVVRRKRDLAMFGAAGLPDPKRWARQTASQLSGGSALDGIRDTVRSMAVRMLRQEAPELTEAQVEELLTAWVPDPAARPDPSRLSSPVLSAMIEQFIAYSLGRLDAGEETGLRETMADWPERYWRSFPPLVRSLLTDFLHETITEREFRSKLKAALDLRAGESGGN